MLDPRQARRGRSSSPRRAGKIALCIGAPAAILLALLTAWSTAGPAAARAESCLAPLASDDADVLRAADAIEAAPALCLGSRTVAENGLAWRFTIIRNSERPGPLWVVPHDEEDAAFSAGVAAVRSHGGVMIAVENREQRLVAGRDPNRVFALSSEAAATCATPAAPLYIAAHFDEWDRAFPIIGLHTNWNGHVGAGGQGTISILRPDAKMVPFPSPSALGRFADEDTVVMLPSLHAPADDALLKEAVAWFNGRGVHVLVRLVTPQNNECTIADFLTLDGIAPYLNIEVEFGDLETEKALVDIVWTYLAADAAAAPAGIGGR